MTQTTLLAHGGTRGLLIEGALVLGLLVLVLAVWKSERHAKDQDRDENGRSFKSHFDDH